MTKHAASATPELPFGGISFLHTTHNHVATFGTLMTQLAPEIPVRHVVADRALAAVRHSGHISADQVKQAQETIDALSERGARVVVCTCTALGACVDQASAATDHDVAMAVGDGMWRPVYLRVDRAAVRDACERADGHVFVAACQEATLKPTLDLFQEEAEASGRSVSVTPILIPDAWPLYEGGHRRDYLVKIAERIAREVPSGGVVLLNQPSMAGAAALLSEGDYQAVSSPNPGVRAAIEAWRQITRDLLEQGAAMAQAAQ